MDKLIIFATNDLNKKIIFDDYLHPYRMHYGCKIICEKYDSIFDFWDTLEGLSLSDRANTLVIYDPSIYLNVPVTTHSNSTNYWHDVKQNFLFPWYELILRYPLITPCFLTFEHKLLDKCISDIKCKTMKNELLKLHSIDLLATKDELKGQIDNIINQFFSGYRTWFDSFGLRTSVRNYLFEKASYSTFVSSRFIKVPSLSMVFCLEDEIEYAVLYSHSFYKNGIRSCIINSKENLKWMQTFINQSINDVECGKFNILRDRDLAFRDLEYNDTPRELTDFLEVDDNNQPSFNQLIISSDDYDVSKEIFIRKPIKSSYSLLNHDFYKKIERFESERNNEKVPDKISNCAINNLDWCSSYHAFLNNILEKKTISRCKVAPKNPDRHSAPPLNAEISKYLIQTASKTHTTKLDILYSALVYREAYMILGGQAKTTSLEIIKNMFLAELEFELSFMGVSKNDDIKDRLNEVKRELFNLFSESLKCRNDDIKLDNLDLEKQELYKAFWTSFWNDAKLIYREYEHFGAAEKANYETMRYK